MTGPRRLRIDERNESRIIEAARLADVSTPAVIREGINSVASARDAAIARFPPQPGVDPVKYRAFVERQITAAICAGIRLAGAMLH